MRRFAPAIIQAALIAAASITATLLVSCRSDDASSSAEKGASHAVVQLVPVGDSGVTGSIGFEADGDVVRITGSVQGLEPGDHGFHVHEHGDLSDREQGKSAGGHFAPHGHEHGRPSDERRHVGDLGNITADDNGIAVIDMTDDVIALSGEHSIIRRSIVVHAQPDDFGQPTGNAGARVAFGVIEPVGKR